MSLTEGDNAGRRLVPTFLNQAAQAGAAWMRAAADRAEEIGLVTWSGLVEGVLSGIIRMRPDLSAAAGVIIGRISLPFAGKDCESKYVEVIRAAPLEQLDFVMRHSLSCIEADSHPECRILLIEEVVEAGGDRGLAHGTDALCRWRAELPPPQSGKSPEDPFFLVRSLEEFTLVLQQVEMNSNKWGAVRAFERIAPRSNYDLARTVFDGAEVLRNDGRAIEAMVRAAFAAGREADATACLALLKELAETRGAWGYGGYTNDKLRYHKLNVLLNGEIARCSAFDAFVGDLADRRESVESLLPEIDGVLELLSPRPTWAQIWACIQDHLSQFREYRIGQEIEVPLDTSDEAEHVLADILFRALHTTTIALGQMARTAALELAQAPGGPSVVAALVPRLWRAGRHSRLEAIQIAWECRDANAVRDAVTPLLMEMCAVDDLAISRRAMSLARAWGQRPSPRYTDLPLIYRLHLPPNPQAERFEPPSGVSSTSSGLYTEDPYSWTWVLESPLRFTAKATGFEIANLRARAAQFMTRIGGANAFGPDAIDRQQARLGRLRLHLSFRKLPVGAAFQAMREVAGELAAAEAIDARAVPLLLLQAGAFHGNVSPLPPVPRPRGVSSVRIPDLHRHADAVEWQAKSGEDRFRPVVGGQIVLAATAVHERRYFKKEWIVEQYFGPAVASVEKNLSAQLKSLQDIIIVDDVIPLYEGIAPGAVVACRPTISASIDDYTPMLCPRVAEELGWRPDPRHVFSYTDGRGRIVAQTLFWRDGGIPAREPDDVVFGRGHILVVNENEADRIAPYLAMNQGSRSWRFMNGGAEDNAYLD
jgi:hypothetical protein